MLFRHEGQLGFEARSAALAPAGFVEERPPPGLARGRYPASPWVIVLIGAALLLSTVIYFFLKLRRRR
ncbi:MAG: hypothetical protein ABJB12_18365 [Pseudomonadota bacterium]